ncbi:hypothetical protein ACROYT_G024174 [Oculina patagonica]
MAGGRYKIVVAIVIDAKQTDQDTRRLELFRARKSTKVHCKTQDTKTEMDRRVLVVFGIVILFTITVLLTDGQKTRRKSPWSRRFIRQRPTKAMSGGSQAQINPAQSAQNSQQQQQDFDSPEDAEDYWRIIYENGDISQPSEPGF